MITDTKWVSKIEEKEGGKSGVYWRVTWHDGKGDNCFDSKMKDVLSKALEEELAVHIEKDKNDKGFWNLMSVTLVADKIKPQEPTHETDKEHIVKPDTPMPTDRDERIVYQVVMKEVGELYRGGFLDENKPVDKKLIAKYKNWIAKTLGISVEYKEG